MTMAEENVLCSGLARVASVISITRAPAWNSRLRTMDVHVDGEVVAKLTNGKSTALPVRPGRRRARPDRRNEPSAYFYLLLAR